MIISVLFVSIFFFKTACNQLSSVLNAACFLFPSNSTRQKKTLQSSSWRSNSNKIHILLNKTFKLACSWEIIVRLFLLDIFKVDLNTKESQLSQVFLREGWGLHQLPSLSPGPSTCWPWDVQTVTLKCIPQIFMLRKRMSPEVLI